MSLKQYAAQIVKGCHLDAENPVARWEGIHKEVTEIKKRLSSLPVKYYHLESARMDLRITPGEKRKWAGVSGHNVPSVEVFVSPDRRGTEGVYYANLPRSAAATTSRMSASRLRKARPENRSRRRRGIYQKTARHGRGRPAVGGILAYDKRFSRIDRFMAETLFDENFGGREGNCHIALGSSYSDTFAGNPARLTPRSRKNWASTIRAPLGSGQHEPKTVTAHLANGKKTVVYDPESSSDTGVLPAPPDNVIFRLCGQGEDNS
jgi:aminopeptidase